MIFRTLQKNNLKLFSYLCELDLFPVKDSFVAYLKRDKSAINRNPKTIDRICERVYQLTLSELKEKIESILRSIQQPIQLTIVWRACGFFPDLSIIFFTVRSSDGDIDRQVMNNEKGMMNKE